MSIRWNLSRWYGSFAHYKPFVAPYELWRSLRRTKVRNQNEFQRTTTSSAILPQIPTRWCSSQKWWQCDLGYPLTSSWIVNMLSHCFSIVAAVYVVLWVMLLLVSFCLFVYRCALSWLLQWLSAFLLRSFDLVSIFIHRCESLCFAALSHVCLFYPLWCDGKWQSLS